MTDASPTKAPLGLTPNPDWKSAVPAHGVFDAEACGRILALGGEKHDGTLGPEQQTSKHRNSRIDWLVRNDENRWLFDQLRPVLQEANRRFFKMNLRGYTEALQLTEYAENQYYDWHMDFGPGPASIRKLSFVVQLSDPADYHGGDLEIMKGRETQAMPREQGVIIIFPSFILHRVAPLRTAAPPRADDDRAARQRANPVRCHRQLAVF